MSAAAPTTEATDDRLDVAQIYERYRRQLWLNLHRLGIPEGDLPDVLQEVLVVVHRRLDSYDGTARLTTWLYGICLRVASNHRRRLRRRREEPLDPQTSPSTDTHDPEHLVGQHRARARLLQVLDQLDAEKRAVFVMFELEGLGCAEIGDIVGAPVGTVHSRLHAARRAFAAALARLESRERHARQVVLRRVAT